MPLEQVNAFIARWSNATTSERANSQLFLSELCDILQVPRPDPSSQNGYAFEYEVTQHHPDGSATTGRIDLYKRGCFVLESKQFQAATAEPTALELAAQQAGVKLPWPKTLPDRVKAVSQLLSATNQPLTSEAVAARFKNARKQAVQEILETLCAIGQAHHGTTQDTYLP